MVVIRLAVWCRRSLAILALAASTLCAVHGPLAAGESSDVTTSSTAKHDVAGQSGPCSSTCRPQDEMWIVSTRGVCNLKCGETPDLSFAVRDSAGTWHDTTLDAYLAATAKGQTRFWVHGYAVKPEEAFEVGSAAYERFVDEKESPVRFVIWSWPSEREGIRRVKDIREKGCRTHVESYCLGWLVSRMNAEADISMIGYSYGTRIIAGGLHVAGGGHICGLGLGEPTIVMASDATSERAQSAARQCRAVLLAAAMGSDWLVDGGFNERALGQTSEMLSIFSSNDRVLKFYPLATKEKHDHALGYTGLAPMPTPDDGNGKFAELDLYQSIGTEHSLETYLGQPEVTAAARHALAPKSDVTIIATDAAAAK